MASYYGSGRYSIDEKGRVSIPPDWRTTPGGAPQGRFFLKYGSEGCLQLYGESEWLHLEEKLRRKQRLDRKWRIAVDEFIRDADWVRVDKQGRITIPSVLIGRAGLAREAFLHGSIDYVAIWSPDRHQQYLQQIDNLPESDRVSEAQLLKELEE